jgi:ribokinase
MTTPTRGSVIVVGSANIDQILRVVSIPAPGETVLSTGASTALGGKGQNQAVAAARSGAATTFIAAIGSDGFGQSMLEGLVGDDIDTSHVRVEPGSSGTALIAVDDSGENTIIVEAGANARLTSLHATDRAAIADAAVLLVQLEIPLPAVSEAVDAAHSAFTTVLLNAAPIRDLPDDLLAGVDVLIVNEHEEAKLRADRPGIELTSLVPVVVVTLGADGAVLRRREKADVTLASPRVVAVDTTGAGDTFCGAFAAALAAGESPEDAMRYAVVAASISVERPGAVPSIPRRTEVLTRLDAVAIDAE